MFFLSNIYLNGYMVQFLNKIPGKIIMFIGGG